MNPEPPEARLARVDAIHTMVNNGTYYVPVEAVAEAILRHHRGGDGSRLFSDGPAPSEPPEPDHRD